MNNDSNRGPSEKEYLTTKEALFELAAEYFLKGFVVLTGCLITILVVWYYCRQFATDVKHPMDIKDVVIIGGLGYGVIVKFYFGEVKGKKPKSRG